MLGILRVKLLGDFLSRGLDNKKPSPLGRIGPQGELNKNERNEGSHHHHPRSSLVARKIYVRVTQDYNLAKKNVVI